MEVGGAVAAHAPTIIFTGQNRLILLWRGFRPWQAGKGQLQPARGSWPNRSAVPVRPALSALSGPDLDGAGNQENGE